MSIQSLSRAVFVNAKPGLGKEEPGDQRTCSDAHISSHSQTAPGREGDAAHLKSLPHCFLCLGLAADPAASLRGHVKVNTSCHSAESWDPQGRNEQLYPGQGNNKHLPVKDSITSKDHLHVVR